MYSRKITEKLLTLSQQFRVVTLIGPRQSGKTTLAKMAFPDYKYLSLEDPEIRNLASSDPRAFFRMNNTKLILDEIQRVPSLLSYIQTLVDEHEIPGEFILTGSHQLQLAESISQSLAGRTCILNLLPMTISELRDAGLEFSIEEYLLNGFYPAIYSKSIEPVSFYKSYYQTYLERDLRLMINIKEMSTFDTFIRLCAGRVGQLLNINSLANEIGVTSNTIKHWLSILEASFIVFRLQPFHENLGKRLVKAPKLYFTDVGLATYLLGVESTKQIIRDPAKGGLFENLVVMEIFKERANLGREPHIYFYRDSNGNEVDVLYLKNRELVPIEIKSAETYQNGFLKNVKYFQKVSPQRSAAKGYVIYGGELEPQFDQGEFINFKNIAKIV